MPHDCIDGSINQSLLNGQEAILVGCKESPEKIYKLKWNNKATLEWVLMKQKLKYPRSNVVAMLIPDALTRCNSKIKGNNLTVLEISTIHVQGRRNGFWIG